MRVHISLDAELVAELDRRVPVRERSRFIADAVRHALEEERRWEVLEEGFGVIADADHDWDEDPAAWVRAQRYGDRRRVG